VRDLSVSTAGGLRLLEGVSLDVEKGERVGLIGESGSGKSLTALAVMGLLADGLSATGHVFLRNEDLLTASERRRCQLRGNVVSMIFQEPMTALNPTMHIGKQVGETLRIHRGLGRRAAQRAAVDLLGRVELPDPERCAMMYPHELSGGQRQRVMMAMAISCDPEVVLADEPTTALDVTVQHRVLELLDRLVAEEGCALLLITHDLAVVSEMCDRVVTMYGGRVVEVGPAERMLTSPAHPYTEALLETALAVSLDSPSGGPLPAIAGSVPAAGAFPSGCPFRDRCARRVDDCEVMPALAGAGAHAVACWRPIPPASTRPAATPAAATPAPGMSVTRTPASGPPAAGKPGSAPPAAGKPALRTTER
jgi:peptide/nickel transport system ATP-binding protein